MAAFFTNPFLLAAMGAVLIPPIIEWLFRRRKRQVQLPTIRFLLKKKEQEKVKRQDRILLLIRMLVIFLLVGSLARPLIRRGIVGGTQERNVFVLLDGTASMQQSSGLTTAFGAMQRKAVGVVKELTEGTKVTVVTVSDGVDVLADGDTDFLTVSARVDRMRPTSGASSIGDGLEHINSIIDEKSPESAELYIFSDFQSYTWQRPGGEAARVAKLLGEISSRCESFVVDVGGTPEFNCMVTALKPDEWVMSTGMPVKFQAVIETWGDAPSDAKVRASFLVDGVKKAVRDVDASSAKITIEFAHQFANVGEYLVEVVLEGDEHGVDNRRLYLCTVPEAVKVLVIDESAPVLETKSTGPVSASKLLSTESGWLTQAIAPATRPGMEKVSRYGTNVIHPSRLAFENLAEYGVVVLTHVSALDESTVAKLEKRVETGGALWMFVGDRVNVYSYNKLLFKDGAGLLPAKLSIPATGAEQAFVKFAVADHPALAIFSDRVGEDSRFLRYFQLEPAPGTRTLLSLSNGQPAIVERAFGRGKVLLTNTTAGTEWSTMQATVEFPMLVQELLKYLSGSPDASVNLNVGDVFEQPVFISSQHMLLRTPDGGKERLTPMKVSGEGEKFEVKFSGTRQQGLYEVDGAAEALPRSRFVVNQNSEEGDLTRLNKSDFKDAFSGIDVNWLDRQIAIEDFAAKRHSVIEVAPALLWALALLLCAESLLALRFGKRRLLRSKT